MIPDPADVTKTIESMPMEKGLVYLAGGTALTWILANMKTIIEAGGSVWSFVKAVFNVFYKLRHSYEEFQQIKQDVSKHQQLIEKILDIIDVNPDEEHTVLTELQPDEIALIQALRERKQWERQ